MTDSEPTLADASASRRALLKGAVGAGVGLAAWSAPKIGTIPAYALTNSNGLFNGTCYFLSFRSQGNNQRWQRGQSTSPGTNVGRASSITRITNTNAEYTWAGALPDGGDLMVTAVGNPVTGTATITLVGAPSCSFATPAVGVNSAQTTGDYTDDRPGSQTCTPNGTATTGTYSLVGSDIQMSGVTAGAAGQSVIIFNIVCN